MKRYKVDALVTGMISDEFDAESEQQAKEMMRDKHGDRNISICANCSRQVGGLTVSEDTNTYEIEEVE